VRVSAGDFRNNTVERRTGAPRANKGFQFRIRDGDFKKMGERERDREEGGGESGARGGREGKKGKGKKREKGRRGEFPRGYGRSSVAGEIGFVKSIAAKRS